MHHIKGVIKEKYLLSEPAEGLNTFGVGASPNYLYSNLFIPSAILYTCIQNRTK